MFLPLYERLVFVAVGAVVIVLVSVDALAVVRAFEFCSSSSSRPLLMLLPLYKRLVLLYHVPTRADLFIAIRGIYSRGHNGCMLLPKICCCICVLSCPSPSYHVRAASSTAFDIPVIHLVRQ